MGRYIKTIKIEAGDAKYDIFIGSGALQKLKKLPFKRYVVVTDEHVAPLYSEKVLSLLPKAKCITVPAGESSKSHTQLLNLYQAFLDFNLTRADGVIALGGGVVGDLTGFAAATYLRGIPFVQVPTTLLAQVDSSVGGKTAVNLPDAKNQVGAFYHPVAVIADTDTLETLPKREWSAGMAEVIKYACIADEKLFDTLQKAEILPFEDVIARCCEIKASYVKADPTDKGKRMELNFGHTLGHVLETLYGYNGTLLHGEAVAKGMVLAARMGEQKGLTPSDTAQRITSLLQKFGLDGTWPTIENESIKAILQKDKKAQGQTISFIFLKKIGEALIQKLSVSEILKQVKELTHE